MILHEKVIIIFFIVTALAFIWTIIQTGKSINNLEEDDDGFYDKRKKR
jgi:cell division protein FtsL